MSQSDRVTAEDERLRALARARVLDTPPEQEFDDLTRLAASVCAVPVAFVGLIDRHRLWFKSRVGFGCSELPRDEYVSDHAFRHQGVFEIPDILADERTRNHPLAAHAPHARFFAGMPLTTPGGDVVGTLGVMDLTPRTLTDDQREALRVLARQVVGVLERRVREADWERTTSALRESEERFRAIFQGTSAGVSLTDASGRFVSCNPAFAAQLGRRVGEVIGRTPADFTHPDDWEAQKHQFASARAGGPDRYTVAKRYLRPDGSSVWTELSFAAIHAADGRYQFGLGVTVDITERKLAEDAIRYQAALLGSLTESGPDGILVVDPGGRILSYNRRFLELWEIPAELTAGGNDDRVLAAAVSRTADPEGFRIRVADIYARPDLVAMDEIALAGGRVLERHTGPVRGPDGMCYGRVWYFRDITARKRADVALRESEERFRAAMEGSLDAVYFLTAERDAGGRITDFLFADLNHRGEQLVSHGRAEVVGRRLCELLPINRTGGFFDKYVRVVETGEPLEEEFPIAADGIPAAWLHHQVVKVGDGVTITSQDVSARKRAELDLRASEQRFRDTVERLAEGVVLLDLDTRAVVRANGAFLDLIGHSAEGVTALTLYDFVAHERGDVDRQVAEVERVGQIRCCECQYRHKDGTLVDVSVSASLVPGDGRPLLSLVVRDVSEQLRHERQLLAYQSELEQANAKLLRLATIDGLTGVSNRTVFDKRLAADFQRAVRGGTPLSLLLIDVDHFKAFNDAFGHPAGDVVLKRVAAALTAAARGTDLVARYGGEEFTVVLPDTDYAGALVAAERFRRTIATAAWDQRAITISVGVATRSDDTPDEKVLVWEADQALYRSKREGRNRVSHGSNTVPATATRR